MSSLYNSHEKYLKAYYYQRPSMYKFIQLNMKSDNKREQFKLMVYRMCELTDKGL